mmetsp:Transcript_97844/g.281092  ORF Transcript_97844/g.281092 Transcript_97844/m.281092 type:complete len:109 (+) Transcript_97844:224-550(+)
MCRSTATIVAFVSSRVDGGTRRGDDAGCADTGEISARRWAWKECRVRGGDGHEDAARNLKHIGLMASMLARMSLCPCSGFACKLWTCGNSCSLVCRLALYSIADGIGH